MAKRAEAVVTELDFQEYVNARTENISKLMVHSLMRVSKTFPLFLFLFLLYIYIYIDLSIVRLFSVFELGNGDQPTLPFRGGRPGSSEAEVG